MKRRTFVLSAGALVPLATAGCLGAAAPDGEAGNRRTTTDASGDRTTLEPDGGTPPEPGDGNGSEGDPNVSRPADGVTPPPEPSDLAKEVAGLDCPTVRGDVDLQVCSTSTDPDEVPVFLAPDRPTFDSTVGTLSVTLESREGEFGFNPYAWSLLRHEGGDWTRVGPDVHPEPWTTLGAGERYTYELGREPSGRGAKTISHEFEPGIYALAVDGNHQDGSDTGQRRIECVALFGVEAAGN